MVDKYKISIIEYLGKLDQGIMVLFGLFISGKYFESIYFYSMELSQVTLSDEVEIYLKDENIEIDLDNIYHFLEEKSIPLTQALNQVTEFSLPTEEEIINLTTPKQDHLVEEIDPSQVKRLI